MSQIEPLTLGMENIQNYLTEFFKHASNQSKRALELESHFQNFDNDESKREFLKRGYEMLTELGK